MSAFDDDVPTEYRNVVAMPGTAGPLGWKHNWQTGSGEQPLCNLFNAMVCLKYHPLFRGMLGSNRMDGTITVHSPVPNTCPCEDFPRPVTDVDILGVQEEMQRTGLRRIARQVVQDAIEHTAAQSPYHPVRAYLDNLEWDGETRIDGWLSRYLGTEGCPYADKIGAMFLIAMVARIYDPGCKSDHMLVLEGKQGILKSRACAVLAGDWYSDGLPDLKGGDQVRLSMHLRGKWLIEVAEMSSFSSAEAAHLKRFLSQQSERFTPKYGRMEIHEPRQCSFVGTTNEHKYLKDGTGGRRFWPVPVLEVDLPGLRADRDQLFAEAVVRYRAGCPWWPDSAFEAEFIQPEQATRLEEDPWDEAIERWLAGGAAFDAAGQPIMNSFGIQVTRAPVTETTCSAVAEGALGIPIGKQSMREARRVRQVLIGLGWTQKRTMNARIYCAP